MELLPLSNFTKGLMTESSPLTYPEGAAMDMVNFNVGRDNTISRRLGLELEGSEVAFVYDASDTTVAKSVYEWRAVGQDGSRNYTVIQVGNELKFFNSDLKPLMDNPVHGTQKIYIPGDKTVKATFASVFGRLVVSHGTQRITVISYDKDSGDLEGQMQYLKVRDLYGVDDGFETEERPYSYSGAEQVRHTYNLFNQGWPQTSFPCVVDTGNNRSVDTLAHEYTKTTIGVYPSNSDIIWSAKVANPGKEGNAGVINNYSPWFLEKTHTGSSEAPKGRFVLDVFERGKSRWAAYNRSPVSFDPADLDFTNPAALDYIPEPVTRYGQALPGDPITIDAPFLRQDVGASIPAQGEESYRVLQGATTTTMDLHHVNGTGPAITVGKYIYIEGQYREITAVTETTISPTVPLPVYQCTFTPAVSVAPSEGYIVKVYDTAPATGDFWVYGWDAPFTSFLVQDVTGISVGDLVEINGEYRTIASITSTGAPETVTVTSAFSDYELYLLADDGPEADLTATVTDVSSPWWTLPPGAGPSNPDLSTIVPEDRTEGYISHISYYAGRVWYSFKEESLVDGDDRSLALGNTLMFSRVAKNLNDISSCMYKSDPTAEDINEIVDSDGGFVTIPELGEVTGLVPLGTILLVFASNGIWQVSGGDSFFSAKNVSVDKVSSVGVPSPLSIVEAEGSVYFLGDGGLYSTSTDSVSLKAQVTNISETTIQSVLNRIPSPEEIKRVKGVYQVDEKKIRWLFNDEQSGTSFGYYKQELVLDLILSAFYIHSYPYTDPFINDYVYQEADRDKVGFLTVSTNGVGINYQTNTDFEDFGDYGLGLDAKAHVVGGWLLPGDSVKWKGASYIITQCYQTEEGYTETGDGGIEWIHPSACKASIMWDWTTSAETGKWIAPFDAYRYMNASLTFSDNTAGSGWEVSTSKRKIRGRGRSLSVMYETEAKKDLILLGYTLAVSAGSI